MGDYTQQLLKKYYPTHLRVDTKSGKISKEIVTMLKEELVAADSQYSLGSDLERFITRLSKHNTYSLPNVDVHVVASLKDCPAHMLMLRVIRRVQCIMNIFQMEKRLTFWLIPCPNLRVFPLRHETVEPRHINGGYTYPAKDTIFVFRQEEFPKVFLHETLHHTSLDVDHLLKANDVMQLYKYFNISEKGCPLKCDTDLRPNEAIVEAWAELYHLSFLSFEYKLPFSALLKKELEWACIQAKRLLRHQNNMHKQMWKESTHSFSYTIIRASLLWSQSKMIELTKARSSEQICAFIIGCFQNSDFQNAIRASPEISGKSFRMTIFGDL